MNTFLDTDILLDFLGAREPFAKHASRIFAAGHQKQFHLYTSSNSITNCYYILSQYSKTKTARQLILELLKEISVIPVTEDILWKGFESNFHDAEDGIQHFAALSVESISGIITRNLKDYKSSKLPVFSSEEFTHKYLQ